jgi:NhaA family Na+:H+ antiporter
VGNPTATDIALAWLAARLVFGDNHPAPSFCAIADVPSDWPLSPFPPDPAHPVAIWLC